MRNEPGSVSCPELAEPALGNYFVSAYPPFSAWRKESVGKAVRALDSAGGQGAPPLGLYIHVPFCVERCDYCYYLAYDDKSPEQVDEYLNAIVDELSVYRKSRALAGRSLDFIYFGGGTPSLPPAQSLERLVQRLQAVCPWTGAREVTFECAPRTITGTKLELLRRAGVTRISLGIQQLDDDILARNGRIHRVKDVERAYDDIRRIGFEMINVDLISGLLGETDRSFAATIDRVIAMQPESVTIYQLEIPHNTPLYRSVSCHGLADGLADWQTKRARVAHGFARLEQAGYSIRSAYAAVRDPRRHTFIYQDEQYRGADVLGVGVAAFSYLRGIHHQNRVAFDSYLTAVRSGRAPIERAYVLDDEERAVREFVLQLKLGSADAGYFRTKYGIEIQEKFREPLARLGRKGWITVRPSGVSVTREGLLCVDRLIPEFYLPQHRGIRYT